MYVRRKFEEDGLDYVTEMTAINSPLTQASPDSTPQVQAISSTSQSSSDNNLQPVQQLSSVETELATQQQLLGQPATTSVNQPVQDSFFQNHSDQCEPPNETFEEPAKYKRGDKVFIDKDGKPTRAMVCEVTPQKKHLKVAVEPKEHTILVEIK